VVDFVWQYGIQDAFQAALHRHSPVDNFTVDKLKGCLTASTNGADIYGNAAGLTPVGHCLFQPEDSQLSALLFSSLGNLPCDVCIFRDDNEVCRFETFRSGCGRECSKPHGNDVSAETQCSSFHALPLPLLVWMYEVTRESTMVVHRVMFPG
jgi:hypothetical protein